MVILLIISYFNSTFKSLIDFNINDSETRECIFYVLVAFNIFFIAFVFISRYLTRDNENNDDMKHS